MGHIEHLQSVFDLKKKAVADIGAGTGAFSLQLLECGARVSAVEIDPEKVARLMSKLPPEIRVLQGRAEALPLADRSQDLLCFFFSFHHVPMQVQDLALEENLRVLKPEGRLHVVEPFPYGSMFDVVRMVEDETEVRTNSHAIMERLDQAGGAFEAVGKTEYTLSRPYPDFETFLKQVVLVDPARSRVFEENRSAIEKRFEEALDRTPEGCFLHQPCAAYHFRKR
ncbi:class I SAM-dependent methyltransferase [Roseibium aggregatum]|uniref:Class I SAM-dependent methyltransferase n=1 Tax=Roseibium aggregatum TaxID=187304 RepID=A0A939ELQ8_9HYPH|nr:class I SAM-dependent methyltransferase [Roseibium aggregatum]MBN9673870.1 class I SAM-dependent methyltransferase [Roseibium aggregatum]